MSEQVKSDKEILKEQKEKREQEIRDIAEHLKKEMGFNSGTGSTMFDLKETPNGPALVSRTRIDETKLPDGWKYATYNSKEGLYRMIGGKEEFIPVEHERDKSEVAVYKGPQDVVDGILAENPHINKGQVYFESHSGAIQLVGVVNDNIKMPAGLKYEDGFIVDTNDYGKKYEVKRMFANDVSKHDITAGGSEVQTYGVKENLAQTAYHEDKELSKYEVTSQQGARFQDYGIKILNFKDMANVYLNYEKDSHGRVVSKQKNGEYRDMNIERENDPLVEARLEVAQVWADAYIKVSGGKNEMLAFSGDETAQKFEKMVEIANSARGMKASELVDLMFNVGMESKIAAYFLTDSRITEMFGINKDISSEMAVQKLEQLKSERLKQNAQNMVGAFSGNAMEEMEDDGPVMERKGPGYRL